MPEAATAAIEREVRIAARPETVFSFFTDEGRMTQWIARRAELDARPGGIARIDYNGFDIMRGEYLEVSPFDRIVLSWGWETLGDYAPRPSRVEITFVPDGDGTVVRLVHSGLEGLAADSHAAGWDRYLARIAASARGEAPPAPVTLSRAEEIASTLNSALVQLRQIIESCSEQAWVSDCPDEGRTVSMLAVHIVGHLVVGELGIATSEGHRAPLADLTADQISVNADALLAMHAGISRADALQMLLTEGPRVVELIRAIPDEALERSQPMAFAGGMPLTAEQVLQGPLLAHITGHLAKLRAACS